MRRTRDSMRRLSPEKLGSERPLLKRSSRCPRQRCHSIHSSLRCGSLRVLKRSMASRGLCGKQVACDSDDDVCAA